MYNIEQVQLHQRITTDISGNPGELKEATFPLQFNHPTKYIILLPQWAGYLQRQGGTSDNPNNFFNYGAPPGTFDSDGNPTTELIDCARLNFNTHDMTELLPAVYLRTAEQERFCRLSSKHMYVFNFANYPLDHLNASGAVNLSRIEQKHLNVWFNTISVDALFDATGNSVTAVYLKLIGINHNVIKIEDHMAGLRFAA